MEMKKNKKDYDKTFYLERVKEYVELRDYGYTIEQIEEEFDMKYGIKDISTFRKGADILGDFGRVSVEIDSDIGAKKLGILRSKVLVDRKINTHCNRELHRLANDEARGQLIIQQLKDPYPMHFKLPKVATLKDPQGIKDTIYVIGDIHYRGDQDNELIQKLFTNIRDNIVQRKYQNVDLGFTGDIIDGEIHNNQLRTNDGVIDCVKKVGKQLFEYINQLPNVRNIKFVYGNHEEIRLGGDKGTKNNVGKLIADKIKDNLRKDITMEHGEMLGFDYKDKKILLIHGHQPMCKNKNRLITTCANEYKMQPDYIVMGHFHTAKANQFSNCDGLIVSPAVKDGKSDYDIEHGYTGFGQYMKLKLNCENLQMNVYNINKE